MACFADMKANREGDDGWGVEVGPTPEAPGNRCLNKTVGMMLPLPSTCMGWNTSTRSMPGHDEASPDRVFSPPTAYDTHSTTAPHIS